MKQYKSINLTQAKGYIKNYIPVYCLIGESYVKVTRFSDSFAGTFAHFDNERYLSHKVSAKTHKFFTVTEIKNDN